MPVAQNNNREMSPIDTHQTLAEGELIQWYRVEKVLGRGGFGITYLATDTNLDHRVAIKEYLPGPLVERQADNTLAAVTEGSETEYQEGLQRFLREAQTLVKFRHPNIVRVMAVFEANNTAYLVMEYEEGEQFKEYVKRDGGIDEASLKCLILSVIDGLDLVHQHGFIHRDIKPVNLIIRKDGSPVLLDFGSTRPVENDANSQHTSFVSVGYTPLEQYQEGAGLSVGPWTDIYSLGATLYYAIGGVTPVSPVSRLAALVKKSKDPLQPAIQIGSEQYSASFLQAIDWALGFKIEDRPQSLSQWRPAFEKAPLVVEESVVESPQVEAEASAESVTRSKLLVRNPAIVRKTPQSASNGKGLSIRWLIGILAACLVVALGARWMHQQQQQQKELEVMFDRADMGYRNGDYMTTARPLYLKILEVDPENSRAAERIGQINNRLAEQITDHIDADRFEQADALIGQLERIDDTQVSAFKKQLHDSRAQQQQLSQVKNLMRQSSYQTALDKIDSLRGEFRAEDAALDTLEKNARAAMEAERERQQRARRDRLEREKEIRANQQRVAAANERQRKRRRDYRSYLNSAEQALRAGEIAAARTWMNRASSLQINDSELEDLEARLESAENFLAIPLTDYELSYARGQFNALERAIEAKNLRAIDQLTEADSSRRALFETLFGRYTQLSVRIMNVAREPDSKRVTAQLRIETMALPNGDVVYPSTSYRDSALSLQRQRYSWSAITW